MNLLLRLLLGTLITLTAVPTAQTSNGAEHPTVLDYLRAYIYQNVKLIEGQPATAAFVAVEDEELNGLDRLSRVDPEIAGLVLEVLAEDRLAHATEYSARRHIANGESLGPDREWNPQAVQANLWDKFLGDERWLRRILLRIQAVARERGVDIQIDAIPPQRELSATMAEITRVYRTLQPSSQEDGESGCGHSPAFAFRKARGADPMLAAEVFRLLQLNPDTSITEVRTTLQRAGWLVQE
jgi:hypothetical protein